MRRRAIRAKKVGLPRGAFSLALLTLLGAFALLPVQVPALGRPIAIVVNPSTPVDDLSLADLRKIFLGDRRFWNSSLRIMPLVLGPGAREREVALRSIYGMSESQFNQYWIAMIMRAEVTSGPRTVSSPETANQLIAGIPGAIGFISADRVQAGVKILRINGKLPGDPGYPLQ